MTTHNHGYDPSCHETRQPDGRLKGACMTENTEKLLPCPFCGNNQVFSETTITDVLVWCKDGCGARITYRHSPPIDNGLPDTIAAWNRRAPAPVETQGETAGVDEAMRRFEEHDNEDKADGDAGRILAAEVRRLLAAKVELQAWKSRFGTSQLTHATARLEDAEKRAHRSETDLAAMRKGPSEEEIQEALSLADAAGIRAWEERVWTKEDALRVQALAAAVRRLSAPEG